jgi:uncharacterized repeat protein (TIGR01451 family)
VEGSTTVVIDDDTADVTVVGIDFQKTTDTPMVLANTEMTFTLTLTNIGDVDASIVSINDPLCGPLSSPVGDDGDGILNEDEVWTFTCTVSAIADFTNVATVTAVASGVGLQAVASAPLDVINPDINVEVTPTTQVVAWDSTASFTITTTNTGDVDLSGISLNDDPGCDILTGPTGGTLSKNQNRVNQCQVNNVTEAFINSLTVEGIPPIGPSVTDSDAATVILSEVAAQCPADMIAYWKLDEITSTGTITYEDTYSAHDTDDCTNCPTSVKGRVNGAQTFNGTSTKVDVPVIPGDDSFNWGKDDSFSIEFWMRGVPGKTCAGTQDPKDNEVIIGRDDSSTDLHWWFGCKNTTGVAFFSLNDINEQGRDLESSESITDGAWHHLVGVRDGVNKENRLYVDGIEIASVTYTYNAGFGSTSAALNVGWLNLGSKFHFEGDLDELALYNKVLLPSEIQAHYNNGIPGPGYCGGPFAPTITSTAPEYANVGDVYTYTVEAVGDPSAINYSLDVNPTGMIIVDSNIISWTPSTTQTETVTVRASNAVEPDDTQVFMITVLPAGVSPTQPVYLPVIMK